MSGQVSPSSSTNSRAPSVPSLVPDQDHLADEENYSDNSSTGDADDIAVPLTEPSVNINSNLPTSSDETSLPADRRGTLYLEKVFIPEATVTFTDNEAGTDTNYHSPLEASYCRYIHSSVFQV